MGVGEMAPIRVWVEGREIAVHVYTIEEDNPGLHTHAVFSLPTALQPGLLQV